MLRRSAVLLALIASATLAEVHIRPPGPYMSSPPPPVDTTPLDPNRKPTCEIVASGIPQQWYGDWNLVTDKSPSGPIEITEPRKGAPSFHARFDARGWLSELVYYDGRRKERWTKLFTYPARIPAGPGDVPVTITWSKEDGSLYDLPALEENLAKEIPDNCKRLELLDILGEPFVVLPKSDGGETWIYATSKEEVRFEFSRKGKLESRSNTAPSAAVAPAVPAAPVAP